MATPKSSICGVEVGGRRNHPCIRTGMSNNDSLSFGVGGDGRDGRRAITTISVTGTGPGTEVSSLTVDCRRSEGSGDEKRARHRCRGWASTTDEPTPLIMWMKIKSMARLIKLIITLTIVVGIISYLMMTYHVAQSLNVKDKYIEGVAPTGAPGEYNVFFVLVIENPTTSSLDIDIITYKAYIEQDYVGEGSKRDMSIKPGTKEYHFEFSFNIKDLSDATRTLFLDENATLRIVGDVTIPVKIFDIIIWTRITLPYEIEEEIGSENDETVPPAPVTLHQPVYVPPSSVKLSWSPSVDDDFTMYEVHMSTQMSFTPSDETVVAKIYEKSTTTYTASNLSHGRTYYFKIRVWDSEGLHSDSNEVSQFVP